MIDFVPQPNLELGRYRHYKGGEYTVLALACDEETHQWRVIYQAEYETDGLPKIWDRAYEIFVEEIAVDGLRRKRFEKIDE